MPKYRVVRHDIAQPPDKSIRYIPLTQGQYAIVDAGLYSYLMQHNWYARWDLKGSRYYAVTKVRNRQGKFTMMHMHRVVLGEDVEVDHENQNSLDNRRTNLRKCAPYQNQANAKTRKDNTSGYKGVSKKGIQWAARIQVLKRDIFIGVFFTPEEAARAYDTAAKSHFREFARCNFAE